MANDIKVYTLSEVAEIIGLTTRTLYNYIKAGQLKAVKVGKFWRVTDKALQDFLETGTDDNYLEFIQDKYAKYRHKNEDEEQD